MTNCVEGLGKNKNKNAYNTLHFPSKAYEILSKRVTKAIYD